MTVTQMPPKTDLPPCPDCGCRHYYREKRFPRKIGISIIVLAAILSFWTYHLSLIAAALIDALIYKLVPTQLTCYRCRKVYPDWPVPDVVKPFDRHVADLYSYGR